MCQESESICNISSHFRYIVIAESKKEKGSKFQKGHWYYE